MSAAPLTVSPFPPPRLTPQPLKQCRCCRAVYTGAAWDALPYVGLQRFDYPCGYEVFVLRNCPCGSTMLKSIETGEST